MEIAIDILYASEVLSEIEMLSEYLPEFQWSLSYDTDTQRYKVYGKRLTEQSISKRSGTLTEVYISTDPVIGQDRFSKKHVKTFLDFKIDRALDPKGIVVPGEIKIKTVSGLIATLVTLRGSQEIPVS